LNYRKVSSTVKVGAANLRKEVLLSQKQKKVRKL